MDEDEDDIFDMGSKYETNFSKIGDTAAVCNADERIVKTVQREYMEPVNVDVKRALPISDEEEEDEDIGFCAWSIVSHADID